MTGPGAPEYRLENLARFANEDPPEEPALYRLHSEVFGWSVDRRRFLYTSAAGLGGLLAACSSGDDPTDPGDPGFDLLTFCSDEVGAHQGIAALAFSRDGAFLASGGTGRGDNHFKLWAFPSGRLVTSLNYSGSGFAIPIAFDPLGRFVATQLPGRITLVNLSDGSIRSEWDYVRQNSAGSFALALSGDGSVLAYADGTRVTMLDTSTGGELSSFNVSAGFLQSLDLSPDGSLLAVAPYGSNPGQPVVRAYSVPDGQPAGVFEDPANDYTLIRRITFTPDSSVLVTSSETEPITFWDVATRQVIRRVDSNQAGRGFYTHALDANGDVYMIGAEGLQIHSVPDGTSRGGIPGLLGGRLVTIAPSPDGRHLAFGLGSSLRLYDLATGRFENCYFDEPATARGGRLSYYSTIDSQGREVWYTLPCGSPIPAGAQCTCNCVSGQAPTAGGSSSCSINFVCTCIPVVYGG
ncbi:MAG: hypothetical protein OEO79_00685 [Gemmatimonadota bacterium]|nr:hypothetical protein [Gemmatimonadota bacterium]